MLRSTLVTALILWIGAASQSAAQVDNARREPSQAAASATASVPELPDAPSALGNDPKSSTVAHEPNGTNLAPSTLVTERAPERRQRTVDRQFILLHALSTMALIADLETTARAVEGLPRATEVNPLFGQHPTRARLYGIGVPLDALTIYVSYHYKKTEPKRSVWKVGPALSIAVHTAVAINNLIVAH